MAATTAPVLASGAIEPCEKMPEKREKWGKGFEGQRKADLGDGRYLNPIMSGDHPDPTILKDGDDFYMTFSSFESDPALIIWHSRDMVNWTPLKPALNHPIGSVFAVDLCKHAGRYFIYIPIIPSAISAGLIGNSGIYVIHADNINGPWSAPISLISPAISTQGTLSGKMGNAICSSVELAACAWPMMVFQQMVQLSMPTTDGDIRMNGS